MGPQGGIGGEGILLAQSFNADLFVLQGPFQHFPRLNTRQDIVGLQDKVAPISPVKGAGLEHGEVGDRRPEAVLVLQPPKQIVIRRVRFIDYRRSFFFPVIDDEVDAVAQARLLPALLAQPEKRESLPFFLFAEFVQVGKEILSERSQIALYLGEFLVFIQDLTEKMACGSDGDSLVEFGEFILQIPFCRLDPAGNLHGLQLNGGRFLLQLIFDRLIEGVVFFFTHLFALHQRNGHKARAGPFQGKAVLGGGFIELLEVSMALGLEFFHVGAPLPFVIFRVKGFGDGFL